MDLSEAIKCRRSIRSYTDQKLDGDVQTKLLELIDRTNRESGLNFQLILNEPKAFNGFISKIGRFSNVKNYIAVIGKKGPTVEEDCGYFGEKIVLEAQRIGLNTCWVGGTYRKISNVFSLRTDDKLLLVIAVGYGVPRSERTHKTKKLSDVIEGNESKPDWFIHGVESALLAPTALNQQKFKLFLIGDKVEAKAGIGFYTKIDLGIIKYHFEIGSGKDHTIWLS